MSLKNNNCEAPLLGLPKYIYYTQKTSPLKGQYHAIFSNTLKIERRYSVDSSQDIMTKIPLKYYQNAKKLSTDVFAGR